MNSESNTTDSPTPVSLEKTEDRCLIIRWSDSVEQRIPFRTLRDGCRCAHCLEKHGESDAASTNGELKLTNELPVLTLAETMPLELVSMEPAGNYAYRIRFSDGHSSGIYSFELLRTIGDSVVG